MPLIIIFYFLGGANRHLLKEESCNERQQGALEGAGLTLEYFNIWKSSLIESLHQNHESFKHFLPGRGLNTSFASSY